MITKNLYKKSLFGLRICRFTSAFFYNSPGITECLIYNPFDLSVCTAEFLSSPLFNGIIYIRINTQYK